MEMKDHLALTPVCMGTLICPLIADDPEIGYIWVYYPEHDEKVGFFTDFLSPDSIRKDFSSEPADGEGFDYPQSTHPYPRHSFGERFLPGRNVIPPVYLV
jgi:hypothetical protein